MRARACEFTMTFYIFASLKTRYRAQLALQRRYLILITFNGGARGVSISGSSYTNLILLLF